MGSKTDRKGSRSQRRLNIVPWLVVLAVIVFYSGFNIIRGVVLAEHGHVMRLQSYFERLAEQGLDVENVRGTRHLPMTPPSLEIWTWRVREKTTDLYAEYVWILIPGNESSLLLLRNSGLPVDNWLDYSQSKGYRSILLPANEAALQVHLELGLPLPDNYSVEAVEGFYHKIEKEESND